MICLRTNDLVIQTNTNFPFTFIWLAIDTYAKNRDPCDSKIGGLLQSILSLGALSPKNVSQLNLILL